MRFNFYHEIPIPDYLIVPLAEVQSELNLNFVLTTDFNPKKLKEDCFYLNLEGLHFFDQELGPLHLDFLADFRLYRRRGNKGKKELIVRALGLEKKTDQILDSTLGLGSDSLFLVQLGFHVIGIERSPIIYMLLKDAWNRSFSEQSAVTGTFKIIFGDSRNVIPKLKEHFRAIYIDPMFPEKKKTALPKREMQIFKKWLGPDLDGFQLLQVALNSRAERVIVKRPLKAEPLAEGSIHQFEGTTVRYDLYIPNHNQEI